MPLHRDLHLPIDYSGRLIAESVLCRLFTEDDAPAGGGCAVKAECLDDGLRWRVTLDEGRRWSDGRALTARHVVDAVGHAFDGRSCGAALFLSPDGDGEGGAPVRAMDPGTVEFRFDRPVAFAPALLTLPAFAPRRAGTDDAGQPLSLGAYTARRWADDQIVLVRADGGGRDRTDGEITDGDRDGTARTVSRSGPDEVRFLHVPRSADAVRRFLAGELDATSPTGFGVAEVAAVRDRDDAVTAPVEIFGSLDLGRRAPRGWLASAAARRALSSLLDRDRLDPATAGLAEPWRWPGTEALGHGAPEGPATEAAAARAGKGVDGPLDIAYSAFDPNAEIAREVADQLSAALGVDVTTTRLSFAEYVRASATRAYCMLYSLTTPAFSHPAGSLSDWRSSGRAARRGGLADPVLDAALDAAEGCLDPGEAGRRWERVADRWCELLPKVPLTRVRAVYLRGRGLSRLTVTRAGLMFLTPD